MPDTEPSSATDQKSAPRPFDIRRVIGGLFVLYGVVVMIAGIVDGDAAKKKAAGIDINLWTGLAGVDAVEPAAARATRRRSSSRRR
jgi:hypothetical protein